MGLAGLGIDNRFLDFRGCGKRLVVGFRRWPGLKPADSIGSIQGS